MFLLDLTGIQKYEAALFIIGFLLSICVIFITLVALVQCFDKYLSIKNYTHHCYATNPTCCCCCKCVSSCTTRYRLILKNQNNIAVVHPFFEVTPMVSILLICASIVTSTFYIIWHLLNHTDGTSGNGNYGMFLFTNTENEQVERDLIYTFWILWCLALFLINCLFLHRVYTAFANTYYQISLHFYTFIVILIIANLIIQVSWAFDDIETAFMFNRLCLIGLLHGTFQILINLILLWLFINYLTKLTTSHVLHSQTLRGGGVLGGYNYLRKPPSSHSSLLLVKGKNQIQLPRNNKNNQNKPSSAQHSINSAIQVNSGYVRLHLGGQSNTAAGDSLVSLQSPDMITNKNTNNYNSLARVNHHNHNNNNNNNNIHRQHPNASNMVHNINQNQNHHQHQHQHQHPHHNQNQNQNNLAIIDGLDREVSNTATLKTRTQTVGTVASSLVIPVVRAKVIPLTAVDSETSVSKWESPTTAIQSHNRDRSLPFGFGSMSEMNLNQHTKQYHKHTAHGGMKQIPEFETQTPDRMDIDGFHFIHGNKKTSHLGSPIMESSIGTASFGDHDHYHIQSIMGIMENNRLTIASRNDSITQEVPSMQTMSSSSSKRPPPPQNRNHIINSLDANVGSADHTLAFANRGGGGAAHGGSKYIHMTSPVNFHNQQQLRQKTPQSDYTMASITKQHLSTIELTNSGDDMMGGMVIIDPSISSTDTYLVANRVFVPESDMQLIFVNTKTTVLCCAAMLSSSLFVVLCVLRYAIDGILENEFGNFSWCFVAIAWMVSLLINCICIFLNSPLAIKSRRIYLCLCKPLHVCFEHFFVKDVRYKVAKKQKEEKRKRKLEKRKKMQKKLQQQKRMQLEEAIMVDLNNNQN